MQEQSRSKKVLPRTLPQAQASNSRLGRVISFSFAALALVSASNAAIVGIPAEGEQRFRGT